ncbi:MAG TPA: NAD(P)H-dependent oxidoreductase [Dehalococcoidia bacterium]|jgi:FMN reductase
MGIRAVAISGSPRTPSKSKTLAETMLETLRRNGCKTDLIDVAVLPAEALVARAPAVEIDKAIATVGTAQIVIAATPTYRALYTGVLKAFFDLMPPGHLVGKICVPIQTAAAPAHFLAIEYGFRPLFASLDGIPISGVYAVDEQFTDGRPSDGLLGRINQVAGQALALAQAP